MQAKENRFFTISEALFAIRHAFAQYPFQLNLLSVIWPMVFGDGAYVLPIRGSRSVWAKQPGAPALVRASEADLKQRILDQLKQSPPDAKALARICALVFGTPVVADSGNRPDQSAGLWVQTDMTAFVCIQCGHCCRTLDYRDGCRVADYRYWQASGRTDILEWVGTVKEAGEITACRIWMIPGTNRFADGCPWLKRSDNPNRYICSIHDVRPSICRQYPGSRKHARMTGCRAV